MTTVTLQGGVPLELFAASGVSPEMGLSVSNTNDEPLSVSRSASMVDYERVLCDREAA